MDLVAENGCSVSIPSGCKRKLGRGSELARFDKTISRDQVSVELKEQRKKVSSGDPDTSPRVLFIEVLGSNPVCILRKGQSTRGKNDSQEVVFLKNGEKDTLFIGDKFSLSLSHPMFFTVREGDVKKGSPNLNTINRLGSIAQDEILQKRKDGKNMTEAGKSDSHVTALLDASASRVLPEVRDNVADDEEVGVAHAVARRQKRALKRQQQQANMLQDERVEEAEDISDVQPEDRDNATNEVGIAQAVARRQKRALERRQQQAHMLPSERAREVEDISDVQQGTHEVDDVDIKTENIDPVKEFGFLVEGSEFDQFKNRRQSNGGRWIWPPPTFNAESPRDDDIEDRLTKKRGRKKTREEDDDEWGGDDQEEEVAIASATKRKVDAKLNLRSHEPSTSKNRDVSTKSKKPKNRREEEEEDEDEADDTLGGFIVNDDEEDPIDDGDDADDEEEELSENEEIEEADEDEDMEETPKKSTMKREEKPLCTYGKNCYRKNPNHLAQFRHQ